jgi:hypothetical protein
VTEIERVEPVPHVPHRVIADLDATFVQEILHVKQRQREADLEHHRNADDLRARLDVAGGGVSCLADRLFGLPGQFKESSTVSTPEATFPLLPVKEKAAVGHFHRPATGRCEWCQRSARKPAPGHHLNGSAHSTTFDARLRLFDRTSPTWKKLSASGR